MAKEELKPLILLLLLAVGLRLAGITFDSLWLDEGYQSLVDAFGSSLPDFALNPAGVYLFSWGQPQAWPDVLSNFKQVDPLCPPLYALLLNRWMWLFGQSDLSIRLLSLFFSILALLVTFVFARRHFGSKAAVLACLLQAVSPFDIYYAQEARMYSLSMLCSALSALSLSLLLTQRVKLLSLPWAVAYVVSTWALINSHYTGLFVVLFQGLWSSVYCFFRKDGKTYLWLIILWLGVLILWWPWFDIFRHACSIRTESFYVSRQASWIWPIWALLFRIPFNWMSFLIGKKVTVYAALLYGTSALILASGVLALSWNRLRQSFEKSRAWPQPVPTGNRDVLIFLMAWMIVPALMVWFLDVLEGHRVIEISRYVLGTAPAVYLFAGWALAGWWQAGVWPQRLFWLHVLFSLVNNAYAHLIPQREPWAEMAAKVEQLCPAQELLLVCQYYDIVCLNRYLRFERLQQGISSAATTQYLEEILNGRKQFWLITAQEGEGLKEKIPSAFFLERQIDLHHALHLRHYRRK